MRATKPFDGDNMYMNENNQEFLSPNQSYSGQGGGGGGNGAGDEDYEIPPITPPNHAEPSLLHLMDPESGYLCHSLGAHHNGLLNPYSYQELPALMMSNMLAQDGHLPSSHLPSIQEMTRHDGSHYDLSRHNPHLINMSPRILSHQPMSALSQLNSQVGRSALTHGSPSPPGSKSATPSPSSSTQEEEIDSHHKLSALSLTIALLLFVSLSQGYKRKTEAAKKEYLKALATYRATLVTKTYNDPVETKSVQTSQPSSHMMPPNPALYSVPPQPSSPYSLGPGGFPLSDMQGYAGATRHALSRTLSQSQMLPSISASPPSSFQISPPLHQQLSMHQNSLLNQPIRMQHGQSQPIISHQMGLQASLHSPPPGQQGFSHLQSEYQKSVGSQSPGAPNPGGRQNHEWDSEYCDRECGGNHCSGSMIARDKPLYLT
nr:TOX high mobility group box family member 2-like [Salvelinus alpinus]